MSWFGKTGVRCDWCGKISNNASGEYTRQDGVTAGYIRMMLDRNGQDDGRDRCDDCKELNEETAKQFRQKMKEGQTSPD